MAEIVKGSNMALSIYNNDTEVYVVVACSRSVTLNLELSAREVTNYNSAFFKEYKPDVIGWDLSDDGLMILDNFGYTKMTNALLNREILDIKFVVDNGVDGSTYYTGLAFITSLSLTGANNDAGTYTISLQGSGQLGVSGTNPANPGDVKETSYRAAGGETSFALAELIGKEMLYMSRGGVDVEDILTVGSPTTYQVYFDSGTGTVTLNSSNPLSANEFVRILYK
jgi:predicted secreted protein